jgi:hypothetical protein
MQPGDVRGEVMILCWAAKGGSGTTVVACALTLASATEPTTLVDLGGDAPAALGLGDPASPGVSEWATSPTASTADLQRLAAPIRDRAQLVPRGAAPMPDDQWTRLATALLQMDGTVIVDVGCGPPTTALHDSAEHSLLVIRPCYLALRRAQRAPVTPSGVVLVGEPGRALARRDVEHALGVGVVAEVQLDPAVARAVDAGLLAARLPASLVHGLRAAL